MASLKEVIDELGKTAKEQNKIASRILKIKGLKRLVVQLNAIPQDGKVRYSMTIHSQNNFKKQLGITANVLVSFRYYKNALKEAVKEIVVLVSFRYYKGQYWKAGKSRRTVLVSFRYYCI